MSQFLEATVDKFLFRVATDRWYSPEGVWALPDGGRIRVGVSDFLQQRSGDVAFVEAKPVGTSLARGEELALIETIKANVEVASPVTGVVAAVNPSLELSPEVINQDPFGDGWLAVIDAPEWAPNRATLLDPEAYFALMCAQAEEEARKP